MNTVSLGDLFEFARKTDHPASHGISGGAYPFFISSQDKTLTTNSPDQEGPALIFGDGGSASVHCVDGPFSVSNHCYIAVPRNRQVEEVRFYNHYLKSNIHLLEAGFKGVGLKNISKSYLSSLPLPTASNATKRRVVEMLDKAEAICSKRKQIIELTDSLLKSIFIEMFGDLDTNTFGWGTYTVAEILKTDPQNGLYRPLSDYGSGVSILRIDGFYDGYLVKGRPLKRLNVDAKTIAKYRLDHGDIVINRVNSPEFIGKSALVEGLVDETVFESNMMRFRVDKEQINPRFFVDQLQTQYIKRQILRASKDAVNQSRINQTDVRNFEIRVPPVELQETYAAIVGKKTKTDRSLTEALSASSNLFRSLSQRVFNSEL